MDIKLPDGWDAGVRAGERDLEKREKAEIRKARIRTAIISFTDNLVNNLFPDRLRTRLFDEKIKEAWKAVRDNNDIQHPDLVESFRSHQQAAGVIAHYYLDDDLSAEEVLSEVGGHVGGPVHVRAIEYAEHLTDPGSSERKNVDAAKQYLWRDYRGGHG